MTMLKMVMEIVKKRNRRRAFSCSDELWEKIERSTKDCISVSKFIRDAVEEKIIRNNSVSHIENYKYQNVLE